MRYERAYSVIGQLLVLATLALIACSVYWTLHGLVSLSSDLIDSRSGLIAGLIGIFPILFLARRSVSFSLIAVLLIAGADRAFFGGSNYLFMNRIIAGACFLIAAVMLIGVLSEHVKIFNKALPQALMVTLGLLFLIPAGLVTKVLSLLGILPRGSDD